MTKLVDLKIMALRDINKVLGLTNRRSKDENVRQIMAYMKEKYNFDGPYVDSTILDIVANTVITVEATPEVFESESSSSSSSSSSDDDDDDDEEESIPSSQVLDNSSDHADDENEYSSENESEDEDNDSSDKDEDNDSSSSSSSD